MKRLLAIILLFSTLNLYGDNTPEPYRDDEFLPVFHDIRRASIIFCGALPLGYMYSSIACDFYFQENPEYQLNGSSYSDLNDSDKVAVKIVSSISFALVITIIDMIIEKFFRR